MPLRQNLTLPFMTSDLSGPLLVLLPSFGRYLRSQNRAENTVEGYTYAARRIAGWLTTPSPDDPDDMPRPVDSWDQVTTHHVEGYLASLIAERSSGYANNQFRALQQWFKWLAKEDEIAASPLTGMSPPKVKAKMTFVLSEDQCRALIATCKPTLPRGAARARGLWGNDEFVARRDEALIRLWLDCGIRRAEMAGLSTKDVNLDTRRALVTGKGDKQRIVRFGRKTANAVDRYLRVRARHKQADLPALWLGEKNRGPLTGSGLYQLVERRAQQIGVPLHPHTFRHTFSHYYRASGGGDDDLMELNGWTSRAMLSVYGKSVAAERALSAYDQHSLGDKL